VTREDIQEKVRVMSGRDFWRTHASAVLDLPQLKVTDGPNGARGDLASGATSACFPVGVAMGASFDPDLLFEIGVALGREAKTKKCQALLGPTINLQRTPIGGRNFECYSEDPYLTGTLASAFVRGVQSQGVAACPKHFVANDTEYERHRVSSNVDARTLRELYLRPFEMVVQDAQPWMIMSSYNRINGIQANSNAALLRGVLKGEWGFDGVVVSDWGGSLSTIGDFVGGLDLEMPGPARSFGDKLVDALDAGEAPLEPLEEAVSRLQRLAQRTAGAQSDDQTEESVDRLEDRALARRAAIAGAVLLKNESILPWDVNALKTVAVIGPNGARGQIMGGGSAFVRAHYGMHPLAALRDKLGGDNRVTHAQGCSIDKYLPAFPHNAVRTPDDDADGFRLEIFHTLNCEGEPSRVLTLRESQWVDFGVFAAVDQGGVKSVRVRGRYTPHTDGVHTFGLLSAGFADLYVDGARIVENRASWRRGESFFSFGSIEQRGETALEAGCAYAIEIRFDRKPDSMMKAVRFGVQPPQSSDMLGEAVAAAKAADGVLLVLGTNPDWETEGHDRADMMLPGAQDVLAEAVLKANPNTVVVLNVGAPVEAPWLSDARAVLVSWFAGQEFGNALSDILFGEAEPRGRLPFTWPAKLDDSPGFKNYTREGLEMDYREGLFMGYRGHLARGPAPHFWFGHGLGYADIAIVDAGEIEREDDGRCSIRVSLANTSQREGSACVQVYNDAREMDGSILRRLCGFARVDLAAGESGVARVYLDPRAFQHWDESAQGWRLHPAVERLTIGFSADQVAFTRAVAAADFAGS
jgi:beta-glucosidase